MNPEDIPKELLEVAMKAYHRGQETARWSGAKRKMRRALAKVLEWQRQQNPVTLPR